MTISAATTSARINTHAAATFIPAVKSPTPTIRVWSESALPRLSNLDLLEAQASYILSETYATLAPVALMFSAGKDSVCLAHLMKQTFTNSLGETNIPFQFIHYDSGDNFTEVLNFRDKLSKQLNINLLTLNVQEAYDTNKITTAPDATGSVASLVELINYSQRNFNLQGLIGGGRRDEDAVRAKERIFSLRNANGQWTPANQRPELWNLYNTELQPQEHLRIFPISNWTEINVWEYISKYNVPLPSIYFAHEREVYQKNGTWRAYFPHLKLDNNEKVVVKRVRCRTAGDRATTGFIESEAATAASVLEEIRHSNYSERAGRQEDQKESTSMENRKNAGWF